MLNLRSAGRRSRTATPARTEGSFMGCGRQASIAGRAARRGGPLRINNSLLRDDGGGRGGWLQSVQALSPDRRVGRFAASRGDREGVRLAAG